MGICPELIRNHEDVEIFFDQLSKNKTTTKLVKEEFRQKKIFRVGMLATLTLQEVDLFQEIKSPAVQTVIEVLKAAKSSHSPR